MSKERYRSSSRRAVEWIYDWIYQHHLTAGEAVKQDREVAHDRFVWWAGKYELLPHLLRGVVRNHLTYRDKILEQELFGRKFQGTVGIAAGLIKKGPGAGAISDAGVSHIELGTYTPEGQNGRERTRMRYYEEDEGMGNWMRFPNPGSKKGREYLEKEKIAPKVIQGVNLGPHSESVGSDQIITDYVTASENITPHSDLKQIKDNKKVIARRIALYRRMYKAFNISSPNTPELRQRALAMLPEIVQALYESRETFIYKYKTILGTEIYIPHLLKPPPDMTEEEMAYMVQVSEGKVDGYIGFNTSVDQEIRASLKNPYARYDEGGISGKPIERLCLEKSRKLYLITEGRYPIIGVGGNRDADAAWRRICFGGASLLQVLTPYVIKPTTSPYFAYHMDRGVAERLRFFGLNNISEAVGKEKLVAEWERYQKSFASCLKMALP